MLKLDYNRRQVSLTESPRWLEIRPGKDRQFHLGLLRDGSEPATELADLVADPIWVDRLALELVAQCQARGAGFLLLTNTGDDIEVRYRTDPSETPHTDHINLAEFQQLIMRVKKDLLDQQPDRMAS